MNRHSLFSTRARVSVCTLLRSYLLILEVKGKNDTQSCFTLTRV